MILAWMIAILLVAGVLCVMSGRFGARAVALTALIADLVLAVALFTGREAGAPWWAEVDLAWIPDLGVRFHLAADGLSAVLIVLTLALGVLAVLASMTEVVRHVGLFHGNLLWTLAGVLGVFVAMDLLLFYFFWELMLVPMYLLIGIWGYEGRIRAAVKFFLFTQVSGLLMLVAIIGLALAHAGQTGELTFDYGALLGLELGRGTAIWLMLGFFVAFAVKLPAVPLHPWLADAHTRAPTAGSVILAGLLLKTGAYGLLRFAVPLFPEASRDFAPIAMTLGVVGILYGAVLAFAQRDLKRLVAYTSVSHLGFVLLGVYAMTELAYQGVMLQIVCHGLSTGGLFILVGAMNERIHTRDMDRMGGLWSTLPRAGAAGMVLAMASLGLPGLGNFVAEVLILFGVFAVSPTFAAVAAAGLVLATVYALRLVQQVFHGPRRIPGEFADLGAREVGVMAALVLALVWLGVFPQPVIEAAAPALEEVRAPAAPLQAAAGGGR